MQLRLTRIVFLAALALVCARPIYAKDDAILNLSYDPTRYFYKEFNAEFAKHWKDKTGKDIQVRMSHAGSGTQARAVRFGLEADVVTLALAADINYLADAGFIDRDWQKKLPYNSTAYTSTIVFLVRKGNPKNIQDWDDLSRPDLKVILSNPKTSGAARWAYLAAWAYAEQKYSLNKDKVYLYMRQVLRNVPILATSTRGATTTFVRRGMGDVLVCWENEALIVLDRIGSDLYELVMPSISILAEPPVAVVDKSVDKHNTREVSEAYLHHLFSKQGQEIAIKHHFRPRIPDYVSPDALKNFKPIRLFTIDQVFGGWEKAQTVHFSSGGTFDQIFNQLHILKEGGA
jgi:sulfate/thiosulfate transport system substrate-binding protein